MNRKQPAYLAWVRTLDCAECGRPGPSESHHLKGAHHQSGAGMKAPDTMAMPLCMGCHQRHHAALPGWKDRQNCYLAETLIKAMNDDILVFDEGSDSL